MPERGNSAPEPRDYLQENTAENFKEVEVKKVLDETGDQLDKLLLAVFNNWKSPELKGWNANALTNAAEYLWNFYEIKRDALWKENVVFKMDNVANFLETISNRLAEKGAPWYTAMSNEKLFWAVVLAIQIALESISRPIPQIGNYDIWVISGKLDENTKKCIEDFQKDHRWLAVDGKPWKWTIEAILRDLKNPSIVSSKPIDDAMNRDVIVPSIKEMIESPVEWSFEWFTSWEALTQEQKATIDNQLRAWKSPVTADMVQDSCRSTGVPVEYLLGFMQNDSRVGTMWKWARTRNPWNVWNTDNWGTRRYATWAEGVQWCAENLQMRIDLYRKKWNWNAPTAKELATWTSSSGKRFFYRYMSAPSGPSSVASMVSKWASKLRNKR